MDKHTLSEASRKKLEEHILQPNHKAQLGEAMVLHSKIEENDDKENHLTFSKMVEEGAMPESMKEKDRAVDFQSAEELLELCVTQQWSIAEAMIRREMYLFSCTREACLAHMNEAWQIMQEAAHAAIEKPVHSMGGLIGGEAKKLEDLKKTGKSLCTGLLGEAIKYAMAVMEVNASMGLIVAAPTAGSSGVLPGVLVAMKEVQKCTDEEIIQALFVAAAVGYLIVLRASVAGAEAGCQAEVGSSSAMAAAAVAYLHGEGPYSQMNAASIALANLLGLVCDPIKGLVESPCQQRNAQGAGGAIIAAQLSTAGVTCPVAFDEMVNVMYRVGKALPSELRETALGGMAAAKPFCDC